VLATLTSTTILENVVKGLNWWKLRFAAAKRKRQIPYSTGS